MGIWGLDKVLKRRNSKGDEEEIINFLTEKIHDTDKSFISTHRIASEVNLTESRVNEVCSKSDKIRRNQKERETWTLR